MATITYNGGNQTSAFNPSGDVLQIAPGVVATIRDFRANGDGTISLVTTAGVLTLTGTTIAAIQAAPNSVQIQGSTAPAFLFSAVGGTVTGTGNSEVIFGTATGGETLTGGEGVNVIFGGGQQTAPNDLGDSITGGTDTDILFGNGGADTISASTGSGNLFGGLGSDVITATPLAGQSVTVYGGGFGTDPTDGADTITIGTSAANLAAGSALVYGNGGSDTINVFTSNGATVYGGLGGDSITAGGANATGAFVIYGSENINADGTSGGLDTINVTGSGNNTIYGGVASTDVNDGDDRISVTGGGNNVVYAAAGADGVTISGGNGNNQVFGGRGNDSISVTGDGNNLIVGGSNAGATNSDSITVSGGGNNTIFGGENTANGADPNDTADTISVTGGVNNIVYGQGGADTINIATSATTAGTTVVYGGNDGDGITVSGGLGAVANNPSAGFSRAVIFGDAGNDTIDASAFAGAATIYGGLGGADSIDGGDTITGGTRGDLIFGNGGNDVITSGSGLDTINGGVGADTITLNLGDAGGVAGTGSKVINDVNIGGDIDVINVGGGFAGATLGNITLRGVTAGNTATNSLRTNGTGQVVIDFNDAQTTNTITLNSASSTTTSSVVFTDGTLFIAGTGGSTVTGTGFADILLGQNGNDSLVGGSGADLIFSGAGVDTLTGGADNDLFVINDGTGGLTGGTAGNKTITDFVDANDDLRVTGGSNANSYTGLTVTGSDVSFTVPGVRSIILQGNATNFAQIDFDNNADGTVDNSLFYNGTAGASNVTGTAGADRFIGSNTAGVTDVINGAAGDDVILGRLGADSLTGGAGNDTFTYAVGDSATFTFADNAPAGNTAVNPGVADTYAGSEVITDLVTGDTVNLGNAGLVADGGTGTTGLVEANEFLILQGTFAGGTFTVGPGGNTGNDSILLYDADGATAGVQLGVIVLQGVTNAEEAAIINQGGVLGTFGA